MAKEKGGSLLNSIKTQIQKSGNSKGAIFYVKSGEKTRIRFLEDFEQGRKITFHDSFEKGVNVPCQKHLGKKCKFCKDKSLRTRDFFAWSIYNYDTKKEQLFMYPVNSFSPLPSLVNMFEVYGSIVDRDFSISRDGKGTSTQYGVVPLDKAKFKKKAKPFSEKKVLEILKTAFNTSNDSTSSKDDDEDDDSSELLEELSLKELRTLAKELDISVKLIKKCKKNEDSLIELINTECDEDEIQDAYSELFDDEDDDDEDNDDEDEEDSEDEEDEEDEEDDDEDEDDDDVDYEELSLKELRTLARERGIKIKKSDKKDDLIEKLEDDDD